MHVDDFNYSLPAERIAQSPAEPRDSARLLVVRREDGRLEHRIFRDLGLFLRPGDLLVANDSRVMPARLLGHKVASGGTVELLLLRPVDGLTWQALVRGRVRAGTELSFQDPTGTEHRAEIVALGAEGERLVRFAAPPTALMQASGTLPLPPYIHATPADPGRYQTVYARVSGSAAAPTAGLHFTPELMDRLATSGIGFAFVTLHIGLDTFKPIATDLVAQHPIHAEWCCLPPETAAALNATRAAGGRVVAVGTTAVRVLETAAAASRGSTVEPFQGDTRLFITPGYHYQVVDALITNFHLPRSTLLLLVAAFMGKPLQDRVYATAIAEQYRFYSFGDAMLVL